MKKSLSIFLMIFLLLPFFTLAQELTAKEVIQKAQDKINGLSNEGTVTMKIVRPGWSREVSMKVWSLGQDYYMIYITAPVKDKGQVFMKRNNDMWNWMPSINRMIKIPPSMMGQSWMGSDFTNDDLVKMNSIIDDYDHSFINDEIVDGLECHVIELIPKPDAAVVWGKVILWVSHEEYYEMKAEYYDEDMFLVNTMTASDIRQFGDRKLPGTLTMVPEDKEGNQTIMITDEMEFNTDIEESFFSQQNMKRVR